MWKSIKSAHSKVHSATEETVATAHAWRRRRKKKERS